jgi:hypothetical protein
MGFRLFWLSNFCLARISKGIVKALREENVMIYVIPITRSTLDLIEVLNSGVRPSPAKGLTYYVYHGPDEHAEILNAREMGAKYNPKISTHNQSTLYSITLKD